MVNKLSIAIAFVILLITGISSNTSRLQASEIEAEEDIYRDSLETIQKIIKFGIDLSSIYGDASETESELETALISFRELIEYLPDTPRGWTAEKPQGETNSFGDRGISQVSQTFRHQDRGKAVKISIFDGAFNSLFSAPFLLTSGFSQESTEGYNKSVLLDNIPGREIYNYPRKQGSLHLLVDSRFLVQIEGSNIEEADLRQWWQSIDRQSLTAIDRHD